MPEVFCNFSCPQCEGTMQKAQRNQAVWWVCSQYPRCPTTAFEFYGKPKFCHEPPNVKPPIEMPLYLDLSDLFL